MCAWRSRSAPSTALPRASRRGSRASIHWPTRCVTAAWRRSAWPCWASAARSAGASALGRRRAQGHKRVMTTAIEVSAAETTGEQASGSSFYAAMRLLPPAERSAMFAVYAFCRVVDDIADEPGPTTAERHAELDAWRADLAALFAGAPPERARRLAEPVRRFALRQEDFLAIVDGMGMDVDGPIRAPSFAT